jgi:hypothetical protein
MCCTIGEVEAKLTGTKLYAGEAMHNGKYVHVLAYQNNAESKWDVPNAMIIPFPTNKPMGPENILDTTKYKNFLDDIGEATRRRSRGMTLGMDSDDMLFGAACAGSAQVFDVGVYTVILADHVAQVPEALKRVSEDKRPSVRTQFLMHYGRMYPKQPVALCCWSGRVEADPLLWWYEPSDPMNLFIPTMDAHDGGPPDLNATVQTDHIISVGSNILPTGSTVEYQDFLYEGAPLLPTKVHGTKLFGLAKNGDTFVHINTMREKMNNGARIKRGANLNKIDTDYPMLGWA